MSKLKSHIKELSGYNRNYYMLDSVFMNCNAVLEECDEEYGRMTYTLGNYKDGEILLKEIYFELTFDELDDYDGGRVNLSNHQLYTSYPC